MRTTKIHERHEVPRRKSNPSWAFVSSSWTVLLVFVSAIGAQAPLPPGAAAIVNEDRHGSLIAICAETGEPAVHQGIKRIRGTGVWVGEASNLHRLEAGLGACDPSWSPDGRQLAVTAADGLWVFPASSFEGSLRVEARLPLGGPTEFSYRAFSHPRWSADGALLALLVTNGGTSWVEVFDAASGRLFYTSPPENYSFSWGGNARELRLGSTKIQLPSYRRR